MRARGRVVAPGPVRRRLGAGLIDLALLGSGVAVAVAAFVGIGVWRGRGDDPDGDGTGAINTSATLARLATPAWRVGIQGVGAGIAVICRNARSPGAWVMHLRRVDARTGGPVTVRSALIGAVVDQVMRSATRVFLPTPESAEPAREQALGGENSGLKRGCLAVLPSMAISLAPALIAPRHQTLSERLSGVVVIDDR